MAAREAVKIVADAFSANLQAKLDALTVTAGESAPTIADFRDEFSDDVPVNDRNSPLVVTLLGTNAPGPGEFESFSKSDIRVPIEAWYITRDRDTATARQTASYALRGMLQTLNDVACGTTENGITLLQLLDLSFDFATNEEGHIAAMLRFAAQMRDNSP